MCRRDFFSLTAGMASAGWLCAQDVPQPVVVLKVVVADRQGRYIHGLTPSDFRVFEDGILQKISSLLAKSDGTRPLPDRKAAGESSKPQSGQETFESIRDDLDNAYTINYHPDPSNHNKGFRRITVQIVPDAAGNWRVRHRPGYRPGNASPLSAN